MGYIALAGLIAAAVSGTVNFIDYILDNNDAIDKLGIEQSNLEENKKNQEAIAAEKLKQDQENAELDYKNSIDSKKLETEQANQRALTAYNQNKDTTTLQFNETKKDVNYKADQSDKEQTFLEWNYSQDLNQQLGLLRQSEQLAGYGYNEAAVSAGKSKGETFAQMAASGTRSSSMNTAVDLEAANNAMQLQLTEDQQRSQITAQQNSLLLQNAAHNFNIQQTRNTNNYNRAQYEVGGGQYNLYQNALSNLLTNYNQTVSQTNAQAEQYYNQRLASWNQTKTHLQDMYDKEYQAFIDKYTQNKNAIQMEIDDRKDFWKNLFRGGSSLLGGSVEGWNTGTTVAESVGKYF